MSEKNYYEEKINEIKVLITSEKFQEALSLILIELNMPYVPAIYEKEFKAFYEQIKPKLTKESQHIKVLSREETIQMLFADNEEEQAIALENLAEHNLRFDKVSLKQRIETWEKKDILKKAFLFELLIDQQVDIEIKFSDSAILNPVKTKSILNNPEVLTLMDEIQKLTLKEPNITQATEQEAKRYLLLTYPNVPSDGKELALALINIVKYMFGDVDDLSAKELAIYQVLSTN